jgi:hypothetical protein
MQSLTELHKYTGPSKSILCWVLAHEGKQKWIGSKISQHYVSICRPL